MFARMPEPQPVSRDLRGFRTLTRISCNRDDLTRLNAIYRVKFGNVVFYSYLCAGNDKAMTKAKTKKIPKTAYGQPGGNQPGKATQFGQPGGNPPCQGSVAANQREFYRWVESKATRAELEAYAKDESKPAMRRQFVEACLNAMNAGDPGLYFDLTNQTHGLPKQVIEQTNLPEVKIVLE